MLFTPLALGATELRNRFVMAPLTRCRADQDHTPTALMAEYYGQRATAGLIVTECTMVTPGTSAFGADPGIYSDSQALAWRETTQAVHAKGGKIFLQIWHAGRAAHAALNGGVQPVSSGTTAIAGDVHTPNGKEPNSTPRALREDEIPAIVAAFAQAAKRAIDAGFDGVEVHGANGYLIDQFLRDGANPRTDAYGGSVENRCRLLFEILDAVSGAIGADRVGLRLSLANSYNSMLDSDPLALMAHVAQGLNRRGIAYLHVMRADFFGQQKQNVLGAARQHFTGKIIANMGYSAQEAEQAIASGEADAIAFGTAFLANPDFPARVQANAPLNQPDPSTFYTPGAKGYTDYATMG